MIESIFLKKVGDLVFNLINELSKLRKERNDDILEIEKKFGPLDYLVPYYVTPDAQNVNPADLDEHDTGLVAKNNVFDLLDRFFSGKLRFSHAFILSDSGMGKTSLLVMLKLFHLKKFIKPNYDISLFKLGQDTLKNIDEIQNPSKNILLLDALDEDSSAWSNFYKRIQEILLATQNFRKVIITCRNQFFPQEIEEDGRIPGIVILSGFPCSKVFLSPFNDEQVNKYLTKRFKEKEKREKAWKIINKMNFLKFRPMLLSYIDFLINHDRSYENAYDVYEALIEEWLNRELRKGIIKEKEPLRQACYVIANKMYEIKSLDLNPKLLKEAYEHIGEQFNIEPMSVEGRSLLHKTSLGTYKFSHYSILEFLIAASLWRGASIIRNTDQVKFFIVDRIIYKKLKDVRRLDLSAINIKGVNNRNIDFSESNLSGIRLLDCTLNGSLFIQTDLNDSSIINCNLNDSNLWNAKCIKSTIENSKILNSNLRNSIFQSSKLSNINFTKSDFKNANLSGATLSSCNLSFCNLQKTNFEKAIMKKIILDGADFSDAILDGADCELCDFSNATLTNVSFRETKLFGAILNDDIKLVAKRQGAFFKRESNTENS